MKTTEQNSKSHSDIPNVGAFLRMSERQNRPRPKHEDVDIG